LLRFSVFGAHRRPQRRRFDHAEQLLPPELLGPFDVLLPKPFDVTPIRAGRRQFNGSAGEERLVDRKEFSEKERLAGSVQQEMMMCDDELVLRGGTANERESQEGRL